MSSLKSTMLSFGVMVLLWAVCFHSVTFAVVFLALLGVHEMGHYIVARALGMRVSTPVFTPVGAMINMSEMPDNAYDEALMAFGGPFVGTAGALTVLLVAWYAHLPVVEMAAKAALFLNLFNLIPLSPLDGGRICMAIDRQLWPIGVALMVIMFALSRTSYLGVFIFLLVAHWAWKDVQARSQLAAVDPTYFHVAVSRRVIATSAYVSLIGFLVFTLMVAT